MPAPLVATPGKKCRLYYDNRVGALALYATPVWTEVGYFEEGKMDGGVETTELHARIGRGITTEATSGFKPMLSGKLTRVKTLTIDPWTAFRDRVADPAKLGNQVLVAEVDGDITVAGTIGVMFWGIVKKFDESRGKDVIQADIEFAPGLGDDAGNTYSNLVVV